MASSRILGLTTSALSELPLSKRPKGISYTVTVNGDEEPILDSDGNPVLGDDGQQLTTFIPTSQTITFPPGSPGAIRCPRGIVIGPNDPIPLALLKIVGGRYDIDPVNPDHLSRGSGNLGGAL